MKRHLRLTFITTCAFFGAVPLATASEIMIDVTGATHDSGQIGCALYAGEAGFPMDSTQSTQIWQPTENGGTQCRFTDLPAGTYAVAVSHDLNGNRKTDTNFLGIPKEAWGVSNNVRPNLRAPRFDEAAFNLAADENLKLDITLDK
ncbi:MAG: DUF2141 domain-containing protein [Rhizobiales bacterium]|nr:DUF2141 domain-containing protein [Hyphomicrobiales bacterium]